MDSLKSSFKTKSEKIAIEIKEMLKEHGTKKIGEVTLSQVYQGMRGITGLVTETSLLDAQEVVLPGGLKRDDAETEQPGSNCP